MKKYPFNVPGRSKAAGIVSIRFKMIKNTRKNVQMIFFDHAKMQKLPISQLKIKFHQNFSKFSRAPSRDRISSNKTFSERVTFCR